LSAMPKFVEWKGKNLDDTTVSLGDNLLQILLKELIVQLRWSTDYGSFSMRDNFVEAETFMGQAFALIWKRSGVIASQPANLTEKYCSSGSA
uniref:MHD1 domain-containing protein n=1 Tax=Haemonchus placei TaxID=6290 RepID=A0A0N4WCT0_HAEPC